MSKQQPIEPVDIQSALEQGKTFISQPPTTPEQVKEALETISSGVEQVRYTEGERLSSTGQAILKDLEEVFVSGAEVSEAIPTETFLHAARAQKEAREAFHPEKIEISPESKEEAKEVVMDIGKLLKTVLTSSELRHFACDFMLWLRSALMEQQKEERKVQEIGQVPMEASTTTSAIAQVSSLSNDQLDRFIGLLEWSQERPEYQEAVGFVFKELTQMQEMLGIEEEEPSIETETIVDKEALQRAVNEAKQSALDAMKALENWTHRSFSGFLKQLQKTANNLQNDKELRNAVNSLSHFISNCFTQPGFLNDRQWIRNEASDLFDQLRDRLSPQNHSDFQALMDESRGILEAVSDEPKTSHLKESLRHLLEDLFMSQEGFQLKTELFSDVGVIASSLMERVRFIRVPELEIHDEEFDFSARNIVLDAAELIPQQFKVTLVTENMLERAKQEEESSAIPLSEEEKHRLFVERDPSVIEARQPGGIAAAATSPWATFLKVEVKGIRGHCKNLHYNMRKRSGFPQLSDEGSADLRVWGHNGMLIKVVLKPEWIVEETTTKTVQTTTETSNKLELYQFFTNHFCV